ncbi:hypothetical protein OBBRIDRAFT_803851 [Obba rivulosa]|uniref:Uncharacterized protein n=1 Tax=Obba rivulosa TaxID=1052685 RepID=A0A8E2AYR2_9APHY|nr:hypothetical protein OBBRIDRAFT_803851 [Obba rivulosa]
MSAPRSPPAARATGPQTSLFHEHLLTPSAHFKPTEHAKRFTDPHVRTSSAFPPPDVRVRHNRLAMRFMGSERRNGVFRTTDSMAQLSSLTPRSEAVPSVNGLRTASARDISCMGYSVTKPSTSNDMVAAQFAETTQNASSHALSRRDRMASANSV